MRKIAYSCSFVPPEWIAAHGFKPVRLVPQNRSSGHEGVCSYMQAFLEEASNGEYAGAVATTLCDQMRRGAETIPVSAPVFLMHVPKTADSVHAARYYADEIRRLGRFLIEMGGRKPDHADLRQSMEKIQSEREASLSAAPLLSGTAFSRALRQMQAGEKIEWAESFQKGGIPVAVIGGPLVRDDLYIFEIIESAGGRIVLDGTEGGERTLPRRFKRQRLRFEPFEELCDAYLSIPDIAKRPNNEIFIWLRRMIKQRQPRGIILLRNVWCDLWHAEAGRLREWLNMPLLDMEGSASRMRNRTRVQAFMEVLE